MLGAPDFVDQYGRQYRIAFKFRSTHDGPMAALDSLYALDPLSYQPRQQQHQTVDDIVATMLRADPHERLQPQAGDRASLRLWIYPDQYTKAVPTIAARSDKGETPDHRVAQQLLLSARSADAAYLRKEGLDGPLPATVVSYLYPTTGARAAVGFVDVIDLRPEQAYKILEGRYASIADD